MKITFPQIYGHHYVKMENKNNSTRIQLDFPARVQILGGKNIRTRYDHVKEEQGRYLAGAAIRVNAEYELCLTDTWNPRYKRISYGRRGGKVI